MNILDINNLIFEIFIRCNIETVLRCRGLNKQIRVILKSEFFKFEWEKFNNFQLNHLTILLELYPNKDWNWDFLSQNPNITFEFILQHPDKDWDWGVLSENPNITFEQVLQNPDKPWDFYCLSENPNITFENVLQYSDKPWNWYEL